MDFTSPIPFRHFEQELELSAVGVCQCLSKCTEPPKLSAVIQRCCNSDIMQYPRTIV